MRATKLVPVMRPRLPDIEAVVPYLRRMQLSGTYSNLGPLQEEVRARFADLLGIPVDQVMTAANATLALAGAVTVSPAERWDVPSFTFTATAGALSMSGRPFRFRDIDPLDWWILDRGSSAPDGLMAVAPFGSGIDVNRWKRKEVVVDAAASIGSSPDLVGLPRGWSVVFSLHATKVLGAGEGAIAVFGDRDRAARFRSWTNFGFSGDRSSVTGGVNAKMSEVQAAYVLAALDRWDEERHEWEQARALVSRLGDELGLTTFDSSRRYVTPYWIVDFGDEGTAGRVEATLDRAAVGTRRWWGAGCHTMPAYRHVPSDMLINTEQVAGRYLGLPIFRGIDGGHIDAIRRALNDAGFS